MMNFFKFLKRLFKAEKDNKFWEELVDHDRYAGPLEEKRNYSLFIKEKRGIERYNAWCLKIEDTRVGIKITFLNREDRNVPIIVYSKDYKKNWFFVIGDGSYLPEAYLPEGEY